MKAMLRLRVEFLTMGAGRDRLGGQVDVGEAKLLGAAAADVAATPSAAIPVPDTAGQVFADLSVTGGPVYVAVGTNPDPSSEPRCLLTPGRSRCLHVHSGQAIVAIAAGDVSQAEAIGGAVTSASPTLTVGDRSPLPLNGHGALRRRPGSGRDGSRPSLPDADDPREIGHDHDRTGLDRQHRADRAGARRQHGP